MSMGKYAHILSKICYEDEEELHRLRMEYHKFLAWHNRPDGHGGIKGGTIGEFRALQK